MTESAVSITELMNELKAASRKRRLEHPDWPSHRPTLYEPGGRVTVYETMPIGRARGLRAYCKYCYTTHRDWWEMDQRDYNVVGDTGSLEIVLCGRCEHTSAKPGP